MKANYRTKTKYFKDFLNDNPNFYDTTNIDPETFGLLREYFYLTPICTNNNEKFSFYFRRNLLKWYPIYKEQLSLFLRLKTYDWFKDNVKENLEKYRGTGTKDSTIAEEETKKRLEELTETIRKALTNNKASTYTETTQGTSNEQRNDTGKKDQSGKERNFNFAYPESNYQGGVVPYDLNNNPIVEFISTQSDKLYTDSQTTSDASTQAEQKTGKTDGSSTDKIDVTDETTRNTDATWKDNKDSTLREDTDTTTNYDRTLTNTGVPVHEIFKSFMETVPTTDFFRQFVDKMAVCFNPHYPDEYDTYFDFYIDNNIFLW